MDAVMRKKIGMRVAMITIAVNFALAAMKLVAGIFGNSSALISDAANSATDVVSTLIVIIGLSLASKPTDASHPYGHERLECVISVILAIILLATGGLIGYNGIMSLINGKYLTAEAPNGIAIAAVAVTVITKETIYRYTVKKAKQIDSVSLKASAWDHREDVFTSLGCLVGIVGGIIGYKILDVIASLVICILIVWAAIKVFIEAVNKLVDKSCPEQIVEEIKTVLLSVDGVVSVDDIKTRMFGDRIYVDVEIGAYEDLTLKEAHAIAEAAHNRIENIDERIKHCMVHVNPVSSPLPDYFGHKGGSP